MSRAVSKSTRLACVGSILLARPAFAPLAPFLVASVTAFATAPLAMSCSRMQLPRLHLGLLQFLPVASQRKLRMFKRLVVPIGFQVFGSVPLASCPVAPHGGGVDAGLATHPRPNAILCQRKH